MRCYLAVGEAGKAGWWARDSRQSGGQAGQGGGAGKAGCAGQSSCPPALRQTASALQGMAVSHMHRSTSGRGRLPACNAWSQAVRINAEGQFPPCHSRARGRCRSVLCTQHCAVLSRPYSTGQQQVTSSPGSGQSSHTYPGGGAKAIKRLKEVLDCLWIRSTSKGRHLVVHPVISTLQGHAR